MHETLVLKAPRFKVSTLSEHRDFLTSPDRCWSARNRRELRVGDKKMYVKHIIIGQAQFTFQSAPGEQSKQDAMAGKVKVDFVGPFKIREV